MAGQPTSKAGRLPVGRFGLRTWFGFRLSAFGASFCVAIAFAALLLVTACGTGKPRAVEAPHTPVAAGAAAPSTTNALVQSCLLCHSTREMQRGPIIDGLPSWYLELQLRRFMTGERGKNPTNKSEFLMGSGISLLQTEEDLATVVQHFSSLPPARHVKTIRGDNERGAAHFTFCATCHGPNGRGREEIKAPPLVVQEDWYLFDQLNRIKAGLRGGQETNSPVWVMHQAVQGLNTQDFRDVVSYVNDELAGRAPEAAK